LVGGIEIQTPSSILTKFYTHPQKVLVQFLPCSPSSLVPRGQETLKLRETFLKSVYKIKDVQQVAKIVMVSLDPYPTRPALHCPLLIPRRLKDHKMKERKNQKQ